MDVDDLIGYVRDELSDFGDVEEAASADLSAEINTSVTEFDVDDASVFDVGDWLYCEDEIMECRDAVSSGDDQRLEVRRAQRGSTAATHAAGTTIRANLKFHNLAILRALNAALAGAYPMLVKVVEDTTLTTVSGQLLYTLNAAMRDIRSVWIETDVGSGVYDLSRLAVPLDKQHFNLYGDWDDGRTIKVICITTFTRMTAGSTLDSDFPDDDEAYDYLVKDAAGRLLAKRAAAEAAEDAASVRGSQPQDNRYVLVNVSKTMRADARESLRKARMKLPAKIVPRPDARYFT